MIFNSFEFLFAFLPITYIIFWWLRSAQLRYIWLTITGYFFYGWWNPWFCLLMLFSTVVSYTAGIGFRRASHPATRRLLLILPICVDLAVLGVFKYSNFAIDNLRIVADFLGLSWTPRNFEIILPVGISFYTFHTISYIVDCYRKDVQPTRNFFEFAAYVSLFSQLVAGPIVRFRQLEGDLEALGDAKASTWLGSGLSMLLTGLIEKTVLADTLATFVNQNFDRHTELSTAGAWLVVYAYSMQLYFDFSGYSTMAAGLGMLFGLRIPQNFDSPYRALNPSDFWRRWHISLSQCMKDYIFIPMGGSRGTRFYVSRNLLLTMLIGGLWHGAQWTFVLWGAWHGMWLVVYHIFSKPWDRLPRIVQWSVTMTIVLFGWVLFRSIDMEMAQSILHKMLLPSPGEIGLGRWSWGVVFAVAGIIAVLCPNPFTLHLGQRNFRYGLLPGAFLFGCTLAFIASWQNSPFLYFQF